MGRLARIPMTNEDIDRLKAEYLQREKRLVDHNPYTLFDPSYLFTIQQRARDVLELLHSSGFQPLSGRRILEVGCGQGGVLLEYIGYGASADCLHGCDLLPERIRLARQILPDSSPLVVTNGQYLPYQSRSFDLVMQYTVFSSILSDAIRHELAAEIMRVLRPGGMVLWYDFWLNPTNPQTRGVRLAEIQRLFPTCQVKAHKITLAPPLARRLVPMSRLLCSVLEKFWVFNSHYLAAITPR